MNRKLELLCFVVLVPIGIFFSTVVFAEISVGVKEGDWIEYQVTINGTVPEEHSVEEAKFTVMAVEGKTIDVDITLRYTNGTVETLLVTLNIETGQIGDAFIIPANLNSGDSFLDQYEGTITISGVRERICMGAKRSAIYASTYRTMRYWDRSTGVLVEANSTFPDFTLITKAEKTNMWQPRIFGPGQTVFFVLIIVAVFATLAIFLILKMRK